MTENLLKATCTFLNNSTNKFQIDPRKYLIHKKRDEKKFAEYKKETNDLLCYETVLVPVEEPKTSVYAYLAKGDLIDFMKLVKKNDITQFICDHLGKTPKGFPRMIFIELIRSVRAFCRKQKFNLEQNGAILSQFYLTHIYFTSQYRIGAEKLYDYFKALQLKHSLPFPPESMKYFTLNETKSIMIFFCATYLRNLPLLRFLCLPNFALSVSCRLEPEMQFGKPKKDKKNKKDKKKKK